MRPFLLIIDGPSGVGKTTAAQVIHERFPRTALLGIDRIKWSISKFKRSEHNNGIVHQVVLAMTKEFLRQSINVIIDQAAREGWVEDYQRLGHQLRCRTTTVLLTASRSELLARIDNRRKTPDAMKRPPRPLSRILRNLRAHTSKRPIRADIIDTMQLSEKEVVTTILRSMKKRKDK